MSENLLETIELSKVFSKRNGFFGSSETAAVDRVNLSLKASETLGLVGESGCGKSTLAQTIIRLYQPNGGRIVFDGADITNKSERELKSFRRETAMIFQDPFAALNPRLTVEAIIGEPLKIHNIGTKNERRGKVVEMLERVGLSAVDLNRFPSEFSGGQQQRIGIARALILRPRLLICDEPVSALDVSVQAQIVNLLLDLQDEFNLAYLFISHNIAVTGFMSSRIAVMYLGRIVEIGASDEIINAPRHPYTQALVAAVPDFSKPENEISITGDVSAEVNSAGCAFCLRCPLAQTICKTDEPALRNVGAKHEAACHFA